MAGGGLQMAGRNHSSDCLHGRFVHLLTDCGGIAQLCRKVLIGWSEIHHGNNVRDLGVRSAYTCEV